MEVLESTTGEGIPDDSELLSLSGHTSHVNPQWRGGFPLPYWFHSYLKLTEEIQNPESGSIL